MSIVTITDLKAYINTNVNTNGANGVTGAEVNKSLIDAVDSIVALFPDKTLTIKDVSDFGTPVSGVVTLLDDVAYFIDGQIDMGLIQLGIQEGGVTIYSNDINKKGLFSTEANYTMFINDAGGAYAGDFLCNDMFLYANGANSKLGLLDNDGNNGASEFLNVNFGTFGVTSTQFFDFTGYRQYRFTGCGFIDYNNGFTFSGASSGLAAESSIALLAQAGSTLFKEGTSLTFSDSVKSDMNFLSVDATAVFMDFDEANITRDSGLSLKNFRSGADNALPNLPATSIKALYSDCTGIGGNTHPGGQYNITTQATTNIVSTGTPVKVAGTTTYTNLVYMSGDNNNESVHENSNDRDYKASGTFIFDGGPNDNIALVIRKWVDSTSSYQTLRTFPRTISNILGGLDVAVINFQVYANLQQNDRLEAWVQNNSNTTNLIALIGSFMDVEAK